MNNQPVVSQTITADAVAPGFWSADAQSTYAVLMDDGHGNLTWRRSNIWRTLIHRMGPDRIARIIAN